MKNVFLCAAVLVLTCCFAMGQAQEKVLWSFASGPSDGVNPVGNLIFDQTGDLYGVTQGGGSGAGFRGTVFELTPERGGSWTESVLYNFCSNYVNLECLDGAFPQAGLVLDSAGNLYGTTAFGGNTNDVCGSSGCGIIFELSPPLFPGGAWTETVLYTFCSRLVNEQCLDGAEPTGDLTLDASGNLYSTTEGGGSGHGPGGTVFELSPGLGGWIETVLYNFCSLGQDSVCPDGGDPRAGVTFDSYGNLLGTTQLGGAANSAGGGTIFKMSPGSGGWTEAVLFASTHPRFGSDPEGGVSLDRSGNVYTTFISGGQSGNGGVIKLRLDGSHAQFWFNGADGAGPAAGVLIDFKRHAIYSTTEEGGNHGGGTVFEMTAPSQEAVLYGFCQLPNCADGTFPAGLIEDNQGNFYGTAKGGGTNSGGVVFEVTR